MGAPDPQVRDLELHHDPPDHSESPAGDLFAEHHEFAARYARHYARRRLDPDVASQVGRLTCWEAAGRWVETGKPFRAYLVRRIQWAVIDEMRASRWVTGPRESSLTFQRPAEFADSSSATDLGFGLADVLADLAQVAPDLPATTRHVAALLAAGLTPTEVAAEVGVSPSRISQHRRVLRDALPHLTRSDPS